MSYNHNGSLYISIPYVPYDQRNPFLFISLPHLVQICPLLEKETHKNPK